jgi:hypothetical protein
VSLLAYSVRLLRADSPGALECQCDREQVLSLRTAGASLGSIAKDLGMAKATVARIVAAQVTA